jgi:large repetitive protein
VSISGFLNGSSNAFSCGASCSQALPQGQGTANFTATSAGRTATGSRAWKFDSAAPSMVSNTSGSPVNGWHTSDVTMSLSATDATSGVATSTYRYRVNGGAWQTGSSLSITADGVYTINAEVQDVAGNTGASSVTVRLDKVPPTVSPSASGTQQNGWYRTVVDTSANAADVTSGLASVQHQVNGGAWQNGASVSVSTDGTHTVAFRATDNAGHVTTQSVTFSVDRTLPVVTHSVPAPGGSNGWHIANVTASLSASDALSGLAPGTLRYRINGGSWITGSSLSISTDGTHTVEAQAQDIAGNTRTISFTVRRDTTSPTLTTSAPGGWINASGTASATASDATSGVASTHYRVNGGAWQAGTSVSIATEGTHTVEFLARDNAGNERTRSETVRVDLTPPTVTAHPDPDGSNGWYTSNPVIPLSANDALSGVAPGSLRYRINGAATWTTGSSLSIAEDGTHTVNLQVNDVAGNTGTDSFNVRVDTTPPDLSIDVSSAVPMQNGWHVEPATAGAVASDATSGIDLVEYRVENAVASTARAGRFSPVPQSPG